MRGCEENGNDQRECILSTLPADATGQLDVFGHDGHTLGVDGAQVGVFKQTHQVGLAGLLHGERNREELEGPSPRGSPGNTCDSQVFTDSPFISMQDKAPRGSHLQSSDGSALEAQVGLEVLGDFSHQTLEGQLADQQLSGLLVATDLTQSHGSRPLKC